MYRISLLVVVEGLNDLVSWARHDEGTYLLLVMNEKRKTMVIQLF